MSEQPNRKGTILLAEDEPALRRLVREVLRRAGYQIHEAKDGEEAYNLWLAHEHEIDLLITDVIMPHMSGGELAQHVTKLRPDLPILFISGYSGNLFLHEIVPRGAAFLQKPFNHEMLIRKVREALDNNKR